MHSLKNSNILFLIKSYKYINLFYSVIYLKRLTFNQKYIKKTINSNFKLI